MIVDLFEAIFIDSGIWICRKLGWWTEKDDHQFHKQQQLMTDLDDHFGQLMRNAIKPDPSLLVAQYTRRAQMRADDFARMKQHAAQMEAQCPGYTAELNRQLLQLGLPLV
jgi:hypothetical protein